MHQRLACRTQIILYGKREGGKNREGERDKERTNKLGNFTI